MANPDRQNSSKYRRTEQEVQNSGFDEVFQVPATELLAFNNNTNTLDRVQINDSGQLLTSATGGGSGDTQYTEDAAAAANPVGTALNLIRDDARGGSLTSTDGDNVAARGTNSGELYVKHVDAIPATQSGTWSVGSSSGAVNVGQKTVNTSAVQVSSSSTVPSNGIIIRALSTNGASVFVGGSGVTTSNGYELLPGESVSFTCNLNTLYIISAASTTDKICWNVV